ncbi:MAG: EpsI family protein [Deltaproteobacteria bacterium]|nr:EpsI family protein [Deltaproteobacteria bacterium]
MLLRRRVWTLIVLLVAVATYDRFLSSVHSVSLRAPLSSVPLSIGGWTGLSERFDDEVIQLAGVDDYLLRAYRGPDGFPLSVYVGFYEQQREGYQVHSPKHCLPGSGWRPTESSVVEFETPGFGGGRTSANRYVIAKGGERQLVLYWYQGAGRNVADEYAAKAYLVLDSILRKRSDGSLIRFMTPLSPNAPIEAVQEEVEAFARLWLPELARVLPE